MFSSGEPPLWGATRIATMMEGGKSESNDLIISPLMPSILVYPPKPSM